jgi:hypothetical protein
MATMQRTVAVVGFLTLLMVFAGCSGARFHEKELPDPASYEAHFPEIDLDGNDSVTWDEFHQYFPQTTTDVFEAVDLNRDKAVDHDEWHEFKAAHGLRCHH